jgi:transcriptional regulator with GAF, ATPase, and Fis domain
MASAWRIVRPSAETNPWHTFLDEAVSLVRGCKLDEAVRVADEALAAVPGDPGVTGRAHSFKGEVASIRGALDETMSEYALAVADLEATPLVGSLSRARRGRADAFFNLSMVSSALEEATRARDLASSIDDAGIRRRAVLESALCEGLIRLELNQAAAASDLCRSAAELIDADCDPLLVGLHYMLGGLAEMSRPSVRIAGDALVSQAEAHFGAHDLPYYRARALEAHARLLVATDLERAIGLAEEAGRLYARAGAVLRHARAQRWLEDVRPPARPTAVGQRPQRRLDEADDDIEGIVLAGPSTRGCVALALSAAATSSTVLVTGESGTGKEQIARLIHRRSARAGRPWVAFNCATVPPDMIESILFGHRRGAFTGAHTAHEGLVRAADGGTFFLDELGELPLSLQAKLLRFLQDGEILPLGETQPVRVDVRIVAATNRDLERETRAGRFRSDLYHRLNVIRLPIAPLRDRREEIPVLARRLAGAIGQRLGVPNAEITAGSMGPLLAYRWPGNVRELSNVLERCLALHGPLITREAIESALALSAPPDGPVDPYRDAFTGATTGEGDDEVRPLAAAMDAFERAYVERVLEMTSGNRSRAAQRLGVSLQRLRYRMRRLRMG